MLPQNAENADLDKLVEDFTIWQKHTGELGRENAHLRHENEILSTQIRELEERGKLVSEELKTVRGIVDNLQGILSKRCDLEDENRHLKKQISTLEDTLKDADEVHKKKMDQNDEELAKLKEKQKLKLTSLQEKSEEMAEAQRSTMQEAMDQKNHEISQIQQQLRDMERDKEADIIKLRLEYDKKLLKMQSAKSRHASKHATQASDIFRQKLQHVKAESEKEVAGLNKVIAELQGKLATLGQRSLSSGPGAPKKMRRF